MNKEYAIYPFRYMNITQRHDQGNHTPHWQGSINYSDKPWDEACQDSGRSYFEPQNDFVIEQVLGLNTITTNSVRLRSVNKLYMPYKEEPDYLYLTLTHMNEDNLKQVSVGQILRKGTKVLLEGTDGYATGNHFHITANLGKYYGLLKNSNGFWCYTYEKSLLPNEAFYVNDDFTTVLNDRSYKFLNVPKDELILIGNPIIRNEYNDQIEVKISNLNCRIGPSLKSKILGVANPGIYDYTNKVTAEGYDWYYIGVGWIAYDIEWCNIYPKKSLEISKEGESIKNDNNADSEKEINLAKKGKKGFWKGIITSFMNWLKNHFHK